MFQISLDILESLVRLELCLLWSLQRITGSLQSRCIWPALWVTFLVSPLTGFSIELILKWSHFSPTFWIFTFTDGLVARRLGQVSDTERLAIANPCTSFPMESKAISHILFSVPPQTSSFGGLLDMVTDRCSTLGLLFVLAIDYEDVHLRLVSMFETFAPASSIQ